MRIGLRRAILAIVLAATRLQAGELTAVGLPNADWAVRLDLTNFTKNHDETRPDGMARIARYSHSDGRLNVTVRIVPLDPGHSIQLAAQDRLIENMAKGSTKYALEDHTTERIPWFEYYLQFEEAGKKGSQSHVFRFWRHGDYVVEIHASVIRAAANDLERLGALILTVRVPEDGGGGGK